MRIQHPKLNPTRVTKSVEGICYAAVHLKIYACTKTSNAHEVKRERKTTRNSNVSFLVLDLVRECYQEPMANAYGKRAHINQKAKASDNHKCEQEL